MMVYPWIGKLYPSTYLQAKRGSDHQLDSLQSHALLFDRLLMSNAKARDLQQPLINMQVGPLPRIFGLPMLGFEIMLRAVHLPL